MRVYLWNLQPLGLSPLLSMPSPWSFSPYRAPATVVQVQLSTKAFPCNFELPDHIPHLDWTPVLTLWNADLTFKVASRRNTRSTCLSGHQAFSSIILKREHLLRRENSSNSSHSHKFFPLDPAEFTSSWSHLHSYYWISMMDKTKRDQSLKPLRRQSLGLD